MNVPALWTKHRGLAVTIAGEFHLPGAEQQDLEQEALIGLWIASRTWEVEKGPFHAFAALVIRRRLASVLKAALRGKHRPLDDSVRWGVREEDGDQVAIVEMLPGGHDPYEVVVHRDALARLIAALAQLTELERSAIAIVVMDGLYAHDRGLENAVYRARRKLLVAAGLEETPAA